MFYVGTYLCCVSSLLPLDLLVSISSYLAHSDNLIR